jgi:cytoskeletal protein CcmA (bactofilin family)
VSTIPAGAVITGEVACNSDLTIHGTISGAVAVRGGVLIVEKRARLRADLRAPHIVVRGQVRGAITATERIVLAATGRAAGSLSAPAIIIEEGARFEGDIDMGRRTIADRIAKYREGKRPEEGAASAAR